MVDKIHEVVCLSKFDVKVLLTYLIQIHECVTETN